MASTAALKAFEFWKNSPPDNDNLLSPIWTETGIGAAAWNHEGQTYYVFVQLFGHPCCGARPEPSHLIEPAPSPACRANSGLCRNAPRRSLFAQRGIPTAGAVQTGTHIVTIARLGTRTAAGAPLGILTATSARPGIPACREMSALELALPWLPALEPKLQPVPALQSRLQATCLPERRYLAALQPDQPCLPQWRRMA